MKDARKDLILEIVEDMNRVRRTMAENHRFIPPKNHLPRAQAELLAIVSHQEGLSIKEIAGVMHVTGSAVTQNVEALVQAGLLIRESDPNDRRTCRVRLSEEGKERFKAFVKCRVKKLATMLGPLSDEELVTLRDLHRKILEGHQAAAKGKK